MPSIHEDITSDVMNKFVWPTEHVHTADRCLNRQASALFMKIHALRVHEHVRTAHKFFAQQTNWECINVDVANDGEAYPHHNKNTRVDDVHLDVKGVESWRDISTCNTEGLNLCKIFNLISKTTSSSRLSTTQIDVISYSNINRMQQGQSTIFLQII